MSSEISIKVPNNLNVDQLTRLFGLNEENITILEKEFNTTIVVRQDLLIFSNLEEKDYQLICELLHTLSSLVLRNMTIGSREFVYAIKLAKDQKLSLLNDLSHQVIAKTLNGKVIYPKTIGQQAYFQALKKNDVVFGIGPAGTGKTYLAVVFACNALKKNEVQKIVLTRPAVEAGENLGFLPGDLKEKVDPYLRPLYDALIDMLGVEKMESLIEKGIIEIAPLAYMRGRTLEDAYVILDEAQNTTDAQMKMFLTRLGFRSKMIITGDLTQIDLPKGVHSGLKTAQSILQDIPGMKFIYLSSMDVVRHPVVTQIIERYENRENLYGKDL